MNDSMLPQHEPSAPHTHLPGLDTLRACAILLVIPRHAWEILKWPSLKVFFGRNGWAGVDLFFVLSGFLIGSQLLQSVKRNGKVDFGRFYLKRSFRILPAYLTVLALYYMWPAFREAPEIDPAWRFIFFVMNFGRNGEAFSHAWSLCIEEHFYLVFPLLVAVYTWRKNLPNAAWLVACVILGGMALRYYLWISGASYYPSVYRPTFTHLDGLTIGVGLALLSQYRKETWTAILRFPWTVSIVGILLVASGMYVYPLTSKDFGAWVLTFPLVSLGFGCLVAAAMAPNFWLARVHIPGTATIATLAYTLYLTHKQMIHLAATIIGDHNSDPELTIALSIVLVTAASLILHKFVEAPFLKLRDFLINRIDSNKIGQLASLKNDRHL